MNKKTLRNNIYKLRNKLELTQVQLANILKCAQPTVNYYETDKISLPIIKAKKLIKYARSKNVDITLEYIYQ